MTQMELLAWLLDHNVGDGPWLEIPLRLLPQDDFEMLTTGHFGPIHRDVISRVVVFDHPELEPSRESAPSYPHRSDV